MPTCPIHGCAAVIPKAHLMCQPHWRMLDLASQENIWHLHRKRERSRLDRHAHMAACFAAMRAVEAKLR
jgi:hypothetical protein